MKLLVDFMREATQELIWLNQKEEIEISRDWSDNDMDLTELSSYNKVFESSYKDLFKYFINSHPTKTNKMNKHIYIFNNLGT